MKLKKKDLKALEMLASLSYVSRPFLLPNGKEKEHWRALKDSFPLPHILSLSLSVFISCEINGKEEKVGREDHLLPSNYAYL